MKLGNILLVNNDSMTDNDTAVFNSTLVLNTSHKGAMAIGNNGALKNIKFFGSAAGTDRPTNIEKGFCFFDTNLNKPIWWTGTKWVDANGTDADVPL